MSIIEVKDLVKIYKTGDIELRALDGVSVSSQTKAELADIRNKELGFAFQGFNLLPRGDAVENVELPLLYRGMKGSERRKAAINALERVGLGGRLHHRTAQMSGGSSRG